MSNDLFCIETQLLTKHYGGIKAIDGLDLRVQKGTCFGLLGPNGAGKTTTVRILSGLIAPTSGSAAVCGLDVASHRDEVKAMTGILPESPGIYSKLSAVEFLEFIGVLNGLTGAKLSQRIDRLLSIMGLESRQDDLLESYSSGMKQKVLVASVVLHEPELVFLDEPTSRLDPAASVLVKEMIRALSQETETSFFICTHMTTLAEELCDIIGVLNEGKLVALDSPDRMIETSGTTSLEQAYLMLVGSKVDRESLLAWRQES